MSAIQKLILKLTSAIKALPNSDDTNHAQIASGFGDAIGSTIDEEVSQFQQQVDDLKSYVDGVAADLINRIANIPVYRPPVTPPAQTCLSYTITNTALVSARSTDVVFTYLLCDGGTSAPVRVFAGNSWEVCALLAPTITSGTGTVVSNGPRSCAPPPPIEVVTPPVADTPKVTPTMACRSWEVTGVAASAGLSIFGSPSNSGNTAITVFYDNCQTLDLTNVLGLTSIIQQGQTVILQSVRTPYVLNIAGDEVISVRPI